MFYSCITFCILANSELFHYFQIKRPYFHVKPLEQCQLSNWKDYLDFEIKEGNQERIILLFERCLIACALYEEFWIKVLKSCQYWVGYQVINHEWIVFFHFQFVEYLLSQPEVPVDKVREVFVRACIIHHPKKLSIHLKWASFEESYGEFCNSYFPITNSFAVSPTLIYFSCYRKFWKSCRNIRKIGKRMPERSELDFKTYQCYSTSSRIRESVFSVRTLYWTESR